MNDKEKEVYSELLKKYGHNSSFTIWADNPDDSKPTSGSLISYKDAIDANELENIKFDTIILGNNPATSTEKDADFSSFHNKNITDRQARVVFKDTPYYGAFFTDLICTIRESIAENVHGKLGEKEEEENFKILTDKIEILSKTGCMKFTILAMGVIGKSKANKDFANTLRKFMQYFENEKTRRKRIENIEISYKGMCHVARQGIEGESLKQTILSTIKDFI